MACPLGMSLYFSVPQFPLSAKGQPLLLAAQWHRGLDKVPWESSLPVGPVTASFSTHSNSEPLPFAV